MSVDFEPLRKILDLEQKKGYVDSAVIGGLDRFLRNLAGQAMEQTMSAAKAGESPEVLALELRRAAEALAEITGRVYTEEILEEIFSRFCIGK